jgi:hypothetical protein
VKQRTILVSLLITILAGACAIVPQLPKPATATPAVMPRLGPSPTPSGNSLPLDCQVTDLKVYINEADGYCFAYPGRFTLGHQPSD